MSRARAIGRSFFARDAVTVARELIGVRLAHGRCAGIIVETEAYCGDAASHYVIRKPSAGDLLGETHGLVYIYRSYGIHICLNFTADADGPGAVLIRALEPVRGVTAMRRRRGSDALASLCSGPGKLAQALGVELDLNGHPIRTAFQLTPPVDPPRITAGPRIGISKAKELPWRFTAHGSRFVSR